MQQHKTILYFYESVLQLANIQHFLNYGVIERMFVYPPKVICWNPTSQCDGIWKWENFDGN